MSLVPIKPSTELLVEIMDFLDCCGFNVRVAGQVVVQGGCASFLRPDDQKIRLCSCIISEYSTKMSRPHSLSLTFNELDMLNYALYVGIRRGNIKAALGIAKSFLLHIQFKIYGRA
ncbi:hypothetical protein D3C74_374410 [compost metagenome]